MVVVPLCSFAQKEWIGQLSLSDFDCDNHTACYTLSIKGVETEPWALGDQNYRFFFDADHISIQSIESLLPTEFYSEIQTDEILELVGQNQEAYSPLDHIDDNLGFLDFNIIANGKQYPDLVRQVSNLTFLPIAEICLEVSEEMFTNTGADYAMNFYFSRPLTAGQITNQFSVISEIDAPNHTRATQPIGFLDIEYNSGLEAQLGAVCQLLNDTKEENLLENSRLEFYPNPFKLGEVLTYSSVLLTNEAHDIIIYDSKSRIVKSFEQLPAGNNQVEFDAPLSEGVYFVHLKSGQHQVIKELIVIH